MKDINIQIENLRFGKAYYLCKPPKFPSYHINIVEHNDLYDAFKRGEYALEEGNNTSYVYVGPDEEHRKWSSHYDESCFKSETSEYAVAAFQYNEHEQRYELNVFRWNELLDLKDDSILENFWKLVKMVNASGIFEYDNIKPDYLDE